jgi:hypothetical protein
MRTEPQTDAAIRIDALSFMQSECAFRVTTPTGITYHASMDEARQYVADYRNQEETP